MPVPPVTRPLSALLLGAGMLCVPAAHADMSSPDLSLAPRIVDALQNIAGPKPGLRKAHPKGVCFAGTFTPDASAAATVTRSPAYTATAPYPVIGRFSMAGPNPNAPDNAKEGRGFAVRLAPTPDNTMDLVLTSTPMFAAANPQDFLDLLLAVGPDPKTGKPDPAALPAYLKTHPAPIVQHQWLEAHPVFASYVTTPWYGIHAFKFVNAAGKTINGKIVANAPGGPIGLSDADATAKGPNFLEAELRERLAKGPAKIEIAVQIGEPGDPTDNPSLAWPESRKTVHLGTVSIEQATGSACAGEMFLPTTLTEGVETGDDPLLPVRAAAYGVSFARRLGGK